MVSNIIFRDLSVPVCGVRRKEWVQLALAAAGVASSLIGGAASKKKMEAAEREQRGRENSENAWYQRRYNEKYTDTAAGQAMINEAKDYARENWKKASGAAAVTGGTDAATAQAKEAGNKMIQGTIRNMASADTARKDSADATHMQMQDNFAKQRIAMEQSKAENIANTASGVSNGLMSMASAFGGDKAKEGMLSKKASARLTGKDNGAAADKLPGLKNTTKGVKDINKSIQDHALGNAVKKGMPVGRGHFFDDLWATQKVKNPGTIHIG